MGWLSNTEPFRSSCDWHAGLAERNFHRATYWGAVWCNSPAVGGPGCESAAIGINCAVGLELCRKALFRISARNVIQISSAAVLFLVSGDTDSAPSLVSSRFPPWFVRPTQVSPVRALVISVPLLFRGLCTWNSGGTKASLTCSKHKVI